MRKIFGKYHPGESIDVLGCYLKVVFVLVAGYVVDVVHIASTFEVTGLVILQLFACDVSEHVVVVDDGVHSCHLQSEHAKKLAAQFPALDHGIPFATSQ